MAGKKDDRVSTTHRVDSPRDIQMDDLAAALGGNPLDSFDPPPGQNTVLEDLLKRINTNVEAALLDLSAAKEEELAKVDVVATSRINYVLSLLALRQFLQHPVTETKERAAKAQVALAYIRQVESSRMVKLQLGRGTSDELLKRQILNHRKELQRLASLAADRELARKKAAFAQGNDTVTAANAAPEKEPKPN